MDQVAKALDGSHHCGHAVRATTHRLVNRRHGSPGHLTEIARQLAVITEIEAQALGNREHKLSVSHFGAYVFGNSICGLTAGHLSISLADPIKPSTYR